MLPLFEMLANAQNGNGMEALSRQFGLTQQQTQAAVEALLPAFSQGLKRNASDPYGVAAFMTAMASGQHAKYFDDASRAFSPQGVQEGNGILGHLFGSKDLSRAVADQAAQATGVGQDVLKQMLPAIAAMIMGGLFKQSTNQMAGAGGFGGGNNPLGEIIEQMMRQGGMAGGPAPQQRQAPQQTQAPDPFDNPFGKVLKDMFGGGAAQQQPSPQQTQSPYGDNPLGKIFEEMLGGGGANAPEPQATQQTQSPYGDNPLGKMFEEMLGGGQQQPSQPDTGSQTRQQTNPGGRQKNPYDDLFGKMFETGSQQRDDYQKGVESIFDQFTRGMDRRR